MLLLNCVKNQNPLCLSLLLIAFISEIKAVYNDRGFNVIHGLFWFVLFNDSWSQWGQLVPRMTIHFQNLQWPDQTSGHTSSWLSAWWFYMVTLIFLGCLSVRVIEGDALVIEGGALTHMMLNGLCVFTHLLQSLSDYYSRCGPPF